MQVRFWGTRGSIATPGPSTNHFGGNTSCVEVTASGGNQLILDCGTGAHPLAIEMKARSSAPANMNILLGHTHWDHIQGFPFFTPAFTSGNEIAIYGPEGSRRSLHDVLAGQMEFTYFPVGLNQLPAAITYHDLTEGIHKIAGMRIMTQFLNHPTMTLGYRIEADGVVVVYLSDHEPYSDQLWRGDAESGRIESILHEGDRRHAKFMAGADLVIHDSQYTPEEYASKKTWGHSPYDYVVEVAAAAGAQRVALTHHDPDHDDHFVAEIERKARAVAERCGSTIEVFCAYEGCVVDLAPRCVLEPVSSATPLSTPVAQRSFRILVVDDDPGIRLMAVLALKQDEHTVIEASSGSEALRLINEQKPDLIVLDFKMPDMDGIEVLKILRAKRETARLPVLILTAMTDEVSTRAGFDAGATDYLGKPFSIPQLTTRVRACMARSTKE
ncbi:MAG TPA: response regulator [Nitrospirales bacterium]|jgi:CheY-like chemotaxis protein/phosphoribosyl 1,2-cyclic phosphodiesterase|nr:response regulator [Nitrospirales bacterium]